MQLIPALATLILSATFSTATPLPPDSSPTYAPPPPPTPITTFSIMANSPGNVIDYMQISAHSGALWLNHTHTPDTFCSNNPSGGDGTPPNYATFLHDNATTSLRLYNGPGTASWQHVYVDDEALAYVGTPDAAPPTDAWTTGWATHATPGEAGGSIRELRFRGREKMWACNMGESWRVEVSQWKGLPIGSTRCVQFVASVLGEGQEEAAWECVYSPLL